MTPRRVLLLNPPGSRIYARDKYCASISKADYYWPQVDLIFQSGFLYPKHKIALIDAIAERLGPADVIRKMALLSPDVTLFLTSSASWPEDMEFIRLAKKTIPFIAVALGGWLLALHQEAMERFAFIDAVLMDFAVPDFADFVGGVRPVNNMAWRESGKIITGNRYGADPFIVPLPCHELIPLKNYRFPLISRYPFTVTNTTVGCPWHCSFCVPGTVAYREREIENVIEELSYIKRLGIKEILFHDSTFTTRRARTIRLLEAMLDRGFDLPWTCQARADTVDRELLELMKKAGCRGIEFGVESGSDTVRDSMRKSLDRERIIEAFRLAREVGINTNAFFIIGMPHEDESSVSETIRFAAALRPTVASFSVPMPHPGTMLGNSAGITQKMLSDALVLDDASPPKVSAGALTPDRTWSLRNLAMRRFYLRPAYFADKIMSWRTPSDVLRDVKLASSLLKGLLLSSDRTTVSGAECPICGFNTGNKEHRERGFDLFRCKWCGVFYVQPMPNEKQLQSYYEGVHQQIRPEVWHQVGDFAYREIVAGLRERLGKSGRILDVGAGTGRLVELLREAGFDAVGVEIAAKEISPNGPIIARAVEDVHEDQFDAVVMLWVLEHLPDPATMLRKLHALIRPGGWIVARVPNAAFISKVMKLKILEKLFPGIFKRMINPASKKESFFEILGPPYHLFGYSPSSLARLFTDFDFKIESLEPGGPLRTGNAVRDNMEKILSGMARLTRRVFNVVFHHDMIVWAQRADDGWRGGEGGKP